MTLVECRVFLPFPDQEFEDVLRSWGGCTYWIGTGEWMNDEVSPPQLIQESIRCYLVAVRPHMIAVLREEAIKAARRQMQAALYFSSYGYAEIIDLVNGRKSSAKPQFGGKDARGKSTG